MEFFNKIWVIMGDYEYITIAKKRIHEGDTYK